MIWAIKTAAGVNYWRPDWCIGQMSLPNAKSSLGLQEMSIEEAVKNGAKTFVIGVVNAGGVMPEEWKSIIINAISSGMNVASGMHSRLSSFSEIAEAAKRNNVQLHDLRFSINNFRQEKEKKRSGKRLLTLEQIVLWERNIQHSQLKSDAEQSNRCIFQGNWTNWYLNCRKWHCN